MLGEQALDTAFEAVADIEDGSLVEVCEAQEDRPAAWSQVGLALSWFAVAERLRELVDMPEGELLGLVGAVTPSSQNARSGEGRMARAISRHYELERKRHSRAPEQIACIRVLRPRARHTSARRVGGSRSRGSPSGVSLQVVVMTTTTMVS